MEGFEKLVFVPRHIERAAEIKEIIEKQGYTVSFYSEKDKINQDTVSIITDTINAVINK